MKKIFLSVVLLMICTTGFAFCEDFSDFGFSMKVPKGYERIKNMRQNVVALGGPFDYPVRPNIQIEVNVDPNMPNNLTPEILDSVTSAYIAEMQKMRSTFMLENFDVETAELRKFGDREGIFIGAMLKVVGSPPIVNSIYIMAHNGRVYTILCTCTDSQLKKNKSKFESAVKSFKILE